MKKSMFSFLAAAALAAGLNQLTKTCSCSTVGYNLNL